MQKIKKDLSAIEKQFETLKQAQKKNKEIPIMIGEVAEIMTYCVINRKEVNEYLESTINENASFIDQNWLDVSIQSMILFFDKVIKHRNSKKPDDEAKKTRRNILSWDKIKTKIPNKDAHQNPYKPKMLIREGESLDPDNTSGTFSFGSEGNTLSLIKENPNESVASKLQEKVCELMDAMKAELPKNFRHKNQICIQEQLNSDLPRDFESLPLEEKFTFLKTSYNKSKTELEKKFSTIYTHYRKEMYIRHETFKTNNDVMLDLKTFLRYYREFEIGKKYKASQATKFFKNLAKNGIWLEPENFPQLHYLLAEIVSNTDEKDIEQRIRIENWNKGDEEESESQELKKSIEKSTKEMMKNTVKLKELVSLIEDEKMKKLLNDKRSKRTINKIVEVHSGFVKEDIFERLRERAEEKKSKEKRALKPTNIVLRAHSPQKPSSMGERFKEIKPSPSFLSIYRQLLIPNLSPGEMKKTSVYESIELLKIHKEKEKLKQLLISEEEDEKYLNAYFKKEKLYNSEEKESSQHRTRTESPRNERIDEKIYEANYKTNSGLKTERKSTSVKKTFSLPRMKFT